jgi:ketosteroid isomerase-like protein
MDDLPTSKGHTPDAHGRTTDGEAGAMPGAADRSAAAEIMPLIELYTRSVDAADTALAAGVWAATPEVSFIHPRGTERGWDEVQANFYRDTMNAPFSARRLTARNVAIHVCGDAAWATFDWNFTATVRADGSRLETSGRETQVFQKTPDGWRLVHIHYSGPPTVGHLEGF